MDAIVLESATCTRCGCLCDDIEVHANPDRIVSVVHACELGREWFLDHGRLQTSPVALVGGRPATLEEAAEAAAGMLVQANMPLVYGLANSTSESQRAAVMLAEEIGAVVDSYTSLTHGSTLIGAQIVGKVTCTLGEVKNRADLVIYWGADPVETHPRHLTRYTLDPGGTFVPGDGATGPWF